MFPTYHYNVEFETYDRKTNYKIAEVTTYSHYRIISQENFENLTKKFTEEVREQLRGKVEIMEHDSPIDLFNKRMEGAGFSIVPKSTVRF